MVKFSCIFPVEPIMRVEMRVNLLAGLRIWLFFSVIRAPPGPHARKREAMMARLCDDGEGRYRIIFDAPNGKRPCLRLKDATRELAELYRDNVSKMVACHGHPETLPDRILEWAIALPEKAYGKLVEGGLLRPREPEAAPKDVTLGAFLTRYIKGREADAKPNTIRNLTTAKKFLIEFFGEDRRLDEINAGDADEWRLYMRKHGWGDNTLRRCTGVVRQLYRAASRVIPLFPELRELLEQALAESLLKNPDQTQQYVITDHRDSAANLRTHMIRIIKRAGLVPWPKLFNNLRSTRETELAEEFPLHVVTRWMGNSKLVAAEHYLQVTDAHFAKAVSGGGKTARQTARKEVKTDENGANYISEEDAEYAEKQGKSGDFALAVDARGGSRTRTRITPQRILRLCPKKS